MWKGGIKRGCCSERGCVERGDIERVYSKVRADKGLKGGCLERILCRRGLCRLMSSGVSLLKLIVVGNGRERLISLE